jgi:hypothetical protein
MDGWDIALAVPTFEWAPVWREIAELTVGEQPPEIVECVLELDSLYKSNDRTRFIEQFTILKEAFHATGKTDQEADPHVPEQSPHCYARGIHSSPFSKGWPDIMGSIAGATLAIEVKQPGKKPTKLQAEEQEKWRRSLAVTGIATSVDDMRDILRTRGYGV